MIKSIVTIILLILIIYLHNCNKEKTEDFSNALPKLDSSSFVHLFDNKGNKLNVVLLSKPFSKDDDYKLYLNNINKYIFLGITSYMEFPYLPSNPKDGYNIDVDTALPSNNSYNVEMYFKICKGWLHCFRNPVMYLPTDIPNVLISESDFIDPNNYKPDSSVKKEYDFIYSCPKVTKDSPCDDWVSFNKNWELALKCLPLLCIKYKLKGLLVGREGCKLPEGCSEYITTTGWLEYAENVKLYNKCRFLFMPNVRDASPRVLTEALTFGLPCLINKNILGGWKYVNEMTGEFFTNEVDIEPALNKLLINLNNYNPRQYMINNYGPINSGKKLKNFLFNNFKEELNVKEEDIEFVTIRNPYTPSK
jgi:hypothetical protein